jgi:hypothetical protein
MTTLTEKTHRYGIAFDLAAPLQQRHGVLVGRVGSTRASVTVYLLPAVAIVLGAVFRHETIAAASLRGTALVTAGAYLTSRAEAAAAGSAEMENSPIIATTTAVTSQEGTL